jgi:branched-chain amino acid aminotransferase
MRGHDTALLMTADGTVAEGPGSCVFLARDGRPFTPERRSRIPESITRDCVIRIARELLGIEVEERAVDRTEAYLADEAFLCGTAAEMTPRAAIDGYAPRAGAPGLILNPGICFSFVIPNAVRVP